MTRRLVILAAVIVVSADSGSRDELVERWNRFARDANAYVTSLNAGVVDLRMRKKVMQEWESMTRCECW